MNPNQQVNVHTDLNGNWVTTTANSGLGAYPSPSSIPVNQFDWRDQQIANLNMILANKENALKEAYCEIGRLHEQIRGMTAFNQWSEGIAKNAPEANRVP